MYWKDIPFHPSRATLRVFGLGLAFLFGVAACWQYLWEGATMPVQLMGGLAVLIGMVAVVFPVWLRIIFVGWMVLVFPVNWLLSHLLLVLIYYLLVTPLALIFRCLGRDVLGLRVRPGQETYWSAKTDDEDVKRYLQPF